MFHTFPIMRKYFVVNTLMSIFQLVTRYLLKVFVNETNIIY